MEKVVQVLWEAEISIICKEWGQSQLFLILEGVAEKPAARARQF